MNKYEEALDVLARYISDNKHGITRYSENIIGEKLCHLEELIDKEKMLEKVLDKACTFIDEFLGECPLSYLDVDVDCDNCMYTSESSICWKKYFMKEGKEND